MKKVIALVLALVLALSCGMMAFAEDTTKAVTFTCKNCGKIYTNTDDYNNHLDTHTTVAPAPTTAAPKEYVCPFCPYIALSPQEYNDHVDTAHNAVSKGNYEKHWDKYIGTDVVTLFSNLIDIFQNTGILDTVKELVQKVWALIENAADKASVAGALSDLEAKVVDLGFGDNIDIKKAINELKEKIKSLYGMNEKATTVEATAAEAPADTGSATAGIAAFAAISMAAAAAYVCTKKKA